MARLRRPDAEPQRYYHDRIPMYPDIDECVRGWNDNTLTRAEVLLRLEGLPTLEQQLDLLSRLPPDFTDEVKDSLSKGVSAKELLPGAYIPRHLAKEQNPEQVARREADLEAYRQRQQRLLEYLSAQKK
jgi:hypothetical protein